MRFLTSSILALLLLTSSSLAQVTWTVDAAGTPPGTGSVADPFVSVQAAILAASSGDVIRVAPGHYTECIDFSGRDVLVEAMQNAPVTILDGGGNGSVVTFGSGEGPNAILRGFTLTGGDGNPVSSGSDARGGGLHCAGASPRIEGCILSGNLGATGDACLSAFSPCTADPGAAGGAQVVGGAPLFLDCSFLANVGGDGGTADFLFSFEPNTGGLGGAGAVTVLSGQATLVRCDLRNNRGGDGGDSNGIGGEGGAGALSGHAALTATSCVLESNLGGGGGSGFFPGGGGPGGARHEAAPFGPGDLVISSCVLRANQGGAGGDVDTPASDACGGDGGPGGLLVRSGLVWVTGATLQANAGGLPGQPLDCTLSAPPSGGSGALDVFSGAANLAGCILWDNLGVAGAADEIASGAMVSVTYCDVAGGFPGTGNLAMDPLFVDAAAGDLRLRAGSPGIDTGDDFAAFLAPLDVDAGPRVLGDHVDMGAHESCLPGTFEDLALSSTVDGAGPAALCEKDVPAGALLDLRVTSPGGGALGATTLLAVELVPPGGIVPLLPSFPPLHLGADNIVLLATSALTPTGLRLSLVVPPGLQGLTVRVQGLADAPANSGPFTTTAAHDLRFL